MTETELIKRCREGDRDAFNELVGQYQGKVINIAYSMLSDMEDAYDAAQEVFVKVYKSIGGFREKSSLSTWIYRITSNVCNDTLRKRQRGAAVVSINAAVSDDDEMEMEIADSAPAPEELMELSERQAALRRAISELNAEHREIITLSDIEQLSYDEVSQILHCPVGTVKSRLNRARAALKKKLLQERELFS